jgi:hypothetical protein
LFKAGRWVDADIRDPPLHDCAVEDIEPTVSFKEPRLFDVENIAGDVNMEPDL